MVEPIVARFFPIPDGREGIAQIVATLNQVKDSYARLPAIRAAALAIVGRVGDNNQAAQVTRLAAFVRAGMQYTKDPLDAEFVQTPDRLLLAIHDRGYASGDCDDSAVLFASLAQSLGIPCTIPAVKAPGSDAFDHVIVVAQLDGGPLTFDLICKGNWVPPYDEFLMP